MSTVSILPKGTRAARLIHPLAHSMEHTSNGEPSSPVARLYAQRWTDTPSVTKALEFWETKAAVSPGAPARRGRAVW